MKSWLRISRSQGLILSSSTNTSKSEGTQTQFRPEYIHQVTAGQTLLEDSDELQDTSLAAMRESRVLL